MPSPFPGIDPFIEGQGFWPDFHARFVNNLSDALYEVLPDNYEARIEERFQIIDVEEGQEKRIGPDIALSQLRPTFPRENISTASRTATLEPVVIPLRISEETREKYIKILHRADRSVVTIIEMLSPSNKETSGRTLYLTKRRDVLYQPIHLVEFDFLLGGQRLPLEKPYPPGDYFALVSRAEKRLDCDVYPWPLAHPLPAIPIPLKAPDPDVILDLAAVYRVTFERARYGRSINYQEPLRIPLDAASQALIRELVARGNGSATPS